MRRGFFIDTQFFRPITRRSFYAKKELYLKNLVCLLIVAFVFGISSLVDAFVVPAVLRPVCSLLCR